MATDLELSVKDVLAAGLSTGHADSYSDLVTELLWQVTELRDKIDFIERERDEAINDIKLVEKNYEGLRTAIEKAIFEHESADTPMAIELLRDALQRKVDDNE